MVNDVAAEPALSIVTVPAAPDPSPRPRRTGWLALAAAVAGGGALTLAFPPFDLWWLAPIGVALLALAAHRRRLRAGFGLGLVAGLVLFIPVLSWADRYVGPVWLLLPLMEACYIGLLGLATALVSPVVDRWRWSWPLVTGALWVAQEALRDRTPFGGFPWGRVAFSQGDSPLLRLAGLGGAPLVTFAVGLVGGLLAVAAWRPWRINTMRVRRPAALAAAIGVAVVAGSLLLPVNTVPDGTAGPSVTVAIVQGNVPRLGLDFNAQRRAVLDNHVNATLKLVDDIRAGAKAQPDLVIWPENSSDIDPFANPDAYARISAATDRIDVPVLVGGVVNGDDGHPRNTGIVWLPHTGPVRPYYIKQHPVPFAEYIPLRPLARMVSDKVDMVRSDFVGGDRPGVLTMGPVTIGDVICFEVAYDNIVRDGVTGGGQIIVVQTNNATFNEAEARQQLAMVRLRAVEHGRPALMASTVGVSAFVLPDGKVDQATGYNVPATIVQRLDLPAGRTIATFLGEGPEFVLVGLAIGALVAAVWFRRKRASGGTSS